MSKSMLIIDTPESCRDCRFIIDASYDLTHIYQCVVSNIYIKDKDRFSRLPDCPLVEVTSEP